MYQTAYMLPKQGHPLLLSQNRGEFAETGGPMSFHEGRDIFSRMKTKLERKRLCSERWVLIGAKCLGLGIG